MITVKTGFPGEGISALSRSNRRNAAVRKRGCAILGRGNEMFKTSNMKKSVITE